MRKDFYLFRHGETDYNKEHRWQGCGIDVSLNSRGIIQAQELASRLRECRIEHIYSSGLKRALQTAQIVAEYLQVGVDIIPELREGCFGEAEGMLKSEIAVQYAEIYDRWYSKQEDMHVRFPDGESKIEMQNRMFKVIEDLLKSPYHTIGIASHGSSIRYLLYKFGLPPHRMENTALFHLSYEKGNWKVNQLPFNCRSKIC